MDEGRFSVSAASLYARLGTAGAPIVVDVRRRPAFEADEWMIAGAIRRPPDTVSEWGAALPQGRPVVVYCVHGQEVSRNTAASLRGVGVDARYLDGGIADWAEHRLPLRKKVPLGERCACRHRPRRRYLAAGIGAAIGRPSRPVARSVGEFRRRPSDARARPGDVRCVLRLVPQLSGREAQLEPGRRLIRRRSA
jgi:rhodanese-related sulfurtransferase